MRRSSSTDHIEKRVTCYECPAKYCLECNNKCPTCNSLKYYISHGINGVYSEEDVREHSNGLASLAEYYDRNRETVTIGGLRPSFDTPTDPYPSMAAIGGTTFSDRLASLENGAVTSGQMVSPDPLTRAERRRDVAPDMVLTSTAAAWRDSLGSLPDEVTSQPYHRGRDVTYTRQENESQTQFENRARADMERRRDAERTEMLEERISRSRRTNPERFIDQDDMERYIRSTASSSGDFLET